MVDGLGMRSCKVQVEYLGLMKSALCRVPYSVEGPDGFEWIEWIEAQCRGLNLSPILCCGLLIMNVV